jgi:death on curing protein
MRLLLMEFGFNISTTEDEKYNFVMGIAKGDLKFDKIVDWLKAKTTTSGKTL